jgi:hypothetical protein
LERVVVSGVLLLLICASWHCFQISPNSAFDLQLLPLVSRQRLLPPVVAITSSSRMVGPSADLSLRLMQRFASDPRALRTTHCRKLFSQIPMMSAFIWPLNFHQFFRLVFFSCVFEFF